MKEKYRELFDIGGKIALVTGGSTGIGKMIASTFVACGAKVYIVGRNWEPLELAAREISANGACIPLQANIANLEEVEHLVAELHQREEAINILVNNAGSTWAAPIEDFPVTGWDKVVNLNLRSVFFLTQKLIPLLSTTSDDWSRIINLSSVASRMVDEGASIPYGASKAGVEQMTRLLAAELGQHHITVNAISPGWFPTRMNAPIAERAGEDWLNKTPLRRFGTADDIGGLAVFLCSLAGAYINGQIIASDGGRTIF